MKHWTDTDLMAHADGELPADRREALDAAMAADPALRARVANFQAQRQRVAAAFDEVLAEPVPDRLSALLAAPVAPPAAPAKPAPVISLAAARKQRAAATMEEPRSNWAAWGGMAAALVVGVLGGTLLGSRFGASPEGALLADQGGQLLARGALAQALDMQLASEPVPGAPVALQLSFMAQDGRYCRTFTAGTTAGLACREGQGWQVNSTASIEASAAPSGTGLRQAATALPPAVLNAVDRLMAGNALNAAQEREARGRDWQK